LEPSQRSALDEFDAHQLNYVLAICQQNKSMASAGRALFNISRDNKSSSNDSSRLQKYLAKFSLKWSEIKG
jgi:transcriptional regulatory protein RtcR